MNVTRTIGGHSLPMNILLVVMNLAGLILVTMGFHDALKEQQWLLAGIGFGLLALSTAGIIFLKGRLMLATVARVLVGSLFIVSGLIKANDPVGFSYKLEEYFEDGALAFRIKEWLGAPGFSLEFLTEWALVISVIICVAEIILGALVLIGGKMRLAGWLMLLMMVFFTFLTWHTANCDGTTRFTDRDTYAMSNPLAQVKIDESKTSKDIRIISKTAESVVVEEMKAPQCVLDCGCFGDAMKGSVGRSLTPKESLWKDIVLLYLVVWIFAARRLVAPNTVRQNWVIVPVALLLTGFFSWVFDWYFPLLFGAVSLITSLWIYRSGGRIFGNHYGSALMTTLWCSLFVWYVLRYDPLKDYRPYAVGTNLKEMTKNGDPGSYVSTMVYRNIRNGKLREFDASGQEFVQSKIWEQTDTWKYDTLINKEIRPMRLASIDTAQFNPTREVRDLTRYELEMPYIREQMKQAFVRGLKLVEKGTGAAREISLMEYNVESYPPDVYTVADTIDVANPDFTEVSVRDLILTGKQVLVVVAKKLNDMDRSVLPQLKVLLDQARKADVPLVFITNATAGDIASFRKKYGFNAPTFTNDETELKVIARSNPCLLVVKDGVVAGKYTRHSLPDFDWIQKNLFRK